MDFRIREARERCGLTQSVLAEKLGINGVTLSGYETGKHDPKSDTLVKIAQICGVSVDFLLGREPMIAEKTDNNQPSAEALQIAYAYDRLNEYGKLLVRTVVGLESKRPAEGKKLPIIEGADDDVLYVKQAAKKERIDLDKLMLSE